MKTLLIILALAAVGGWYVLNQLKQSKQVAAVQQSAVQYTNTLQQDAKKAKQAADAANAAIQKTAKQVEEAIPQ